MDRHNPYYNGPYDPRRVGDRKVQVKMESPPPLPNYPQLLLEKDKMIEELKMQCVNVCNLHEDVRLKLEESEKDKAELHDKVKKFEEMYQEKNSLYNDSSIEIVRLKNCIQDWRKYTDGKKKIICELEEKLKKAEENAKTGEANLVEKDKEINQKEKDVLERNAQIIEKDKKISFLEIELKEQNSELEELRRAVLTFSEGDKLHEDKIQHLQNDLARKKDELQTAHKNMDHHLRKRNEQDALLKKLQEEVDTKSKEVANSVEIRAQLRRNIQTRDDKILELETEIKANAVKVDELQMKISSSEANVSDKDNKIKKLEQKLSSLRDKLDRKSRLVNENAELQKKLNDKVALAESQAVAIAEANAKLMALQERCDGEAGRIQEISQKLTCDLQGAEGERDKLLKFAEEIKTFVKWTQNESCPLILQLDKLLEHVINKNSNVKTGGVTTHKPEVITLDDSPTGSPSTSNQSQPELRKVQKTIDKRKSSEGKDMKLLKCDQCPIHFSDRSQMNLHVRKMHSKPSGTPQKDDVSQADKKPTITPRINNNAKEVVTKETSVPQETQVVEKKVDSAPVSMDTDEDDFVDVEALDSPNP